MAKLKTLTIDSVANNVPVIEVGDYLKYDETLGKIEQVPVIIAPSGGAVSVPTGATGKNTDYYTFDSDGVAIIRAVATFPANTTGYRYMNLKLNTGGSIGQRLSPSNSGTTILSCADVFNISNGSIVRVGLTQTSGSTMNVDVYVRILFFPKTYE